MYLLLGPGVCLIAKCCRSRLCIRGAVHISQNGWSIDNHDRHKCRERVRKTGGSSPCHAIQTL